VDIALNTQALITLLMPLLGAVIAGLFGQRIGRRLTHWVTILCVTVSLIFAGSIFNQIVLQNQPSMNTVLYHWVTSGTFNFDVGLLIDRLSATMIFIVTFVSLMVHIYTIGYMAEDDGYQRFFSYVSLFTFAMLALVLANNLLLLFFGWEGVGLVSYLLIGFWFHKEPAVEGALKAFLVNRIGDIAFILAIAGVLMLFGQVDYAYMFQHVPEILDKQIHLSQHIAFPAVTVICLLFFFGAMAKSAQVPLHVWLPESMEGPTPISALIHAATMVTAGIYLVARLSPLFEFSPAALNFVLVIGAISSLSMGLIAITQHDIKLVIAYSTLSQLGYMTVALGASAYNAAIFHLVTHAFFKALLFLSAGSVIVAMHHEQDMRKMGGLARFMPITYLTFAIGALALAAIPPFAGFYSKDAIIEAVHLSTLPAAGFAYGCVLAGAFITPLYIFRAFFLTFHGRSRLTNAGLASAKTPGVHESPWVILIPLLALAVPSIFIGGMLIGPMLFQQPNLLGNSIFVLPNHDVLAKLAVNFEGAKEMAMHAGASLTMWLALGGIATAWLFNLGAPQLSQKLKAACPTFYKILMKKYGFDDFNQLFFVQGTRKLGTFFYKVSDLWMIDGIFVNGSGKFIQWFANFSRKIQTGYIYHYAFVMVAGLVVYLGWLILGI